MTGRVGGEHTVGRHGPAKGGCEVKESGELSGKYKCHRTIPGWAPRVSPIWLLNQAPQIRIVIAKRGQRYELIAKSGQKYELIAKLGQKYELIAKSGQKYELIAKLGQTSKWIAKPAQKYNL